MITSLKATARPLQAANLFLSPTTGQYVKGASLSATVYVSSDQAINAVSGKLSFPTDKLAVTSVVTGGSIVNLWVAEPSYSNSSGSVNFEGIILNPGFSGKSGKVLTVNFTAQTGGEAAINFSVGSILANDGQGTEVLKGLGGAKFTVIVENQDTDSAEDNKKDPASEAPTVPQQPEAKVEKPPYAPKLSSSTHPDSEAWYNDLNPRIVWSLPKGATAAKVLLDHSANTAPSAVYSPAISARQLNDLDDGVWYLHVSLRNEFGWGAVSHYRLQIDTAAPSNVIVKLASPSDASSPTPNLLISADDSLSGLDHYEIKIDEQAPIVWQDPGDHRYQTLPLSPGTHTISVTAFDKAGNSAQASLQINSKASIVPLVGKYQQELLAGETLVVSGQTEPAARLVLRLTKDNGLSTEYETTANNQGAFTFAIEDLASGDYKFKIENVSNTSAEQKLSEEYSLVVKAGKFAFLNTTNVLIFVVLVLLFLFLDLKVRPYYKQRRAGKQQTVKAPVRVDAHKITLYFNEHMHLLKKASAQNKLTKKDLQSLLIFKQFLIKLESKIDCVIKRNLK